MTPKKLRDPSAPAQLYRMFHGTFQAQLLFIAAELGVPDLLRHGPRSLEDLAAATGTKGERLYRVLRALTSLGVCVELRSREFGITSLAEPLLTEPPGNIRALARYLGSEWRLRSWGNALHSLRQEDSAFHGAFGAPLFDYLRANPAEAAVFDEAMAQTACNIAAALCTAYDFSAFERIVDVGGGQGALLAGVLERFPSARGVLLDVSPPDVARALLNDRDLGDRCDVIEGDFLDEVPGGADLYVLQRILHDWDDSHACRILQSVRKAMRPEARLLLIEMLLPEGTISLEAAASDIEMLVLTDGGRERTHAEFVALLESADMTVSRVVPTSSPWTIIEAQPAPLPAPTSASD